MRTAESIPTLRTPGVIARELGQPLHRVLYVLRTRPDIAPAARAGRLRLYERAAVDQIRRELAFIEARRSPFCVPSDISQRKELGHG